MKEGGERSKYRGFYPLLFDPGCSYILDIEVMSPQPPHLFSQQGNNNQKAVLGYFLSWSSGKYPCVATGLVPLTFRSVVTIRAGWATMWSSA